MKFVIEFVLVWGFSVREVIVVNLVFRLMGSFYYVIFFLIVLIGIW